MAYSDEQINEFLDLAQDVGITKAKRELGYPNSWGTAQRWAQMRGITVAVDEVHAKATATREWYKQEEIQVIAQEGFNRVHEALTNDPDLTADDQKKLAEALQKHYNVWASVQGKTQVTGNETPDLFEAKIQAMISSERSRMEIKEVMPNSNQNL
jgi:hypothetical protein